MKTYEKGTPVVDEKFQIKITKDGPYLVFGSPDIRTQTIVSNGQGDSWEYVPGKFNYSKEPQPVALCRCGHTKNPPYCDGSHLKIKWNAELTAPRTSLLDEAGQVEGPTLTLTDNEKYCAFARFCDTKEGTWSLTEESGDYEKRALAIKTADNCPSGRLKEWDNATGEPFEPTLAPSIGLIEDPTVGVSGPIWVRGGIPISAPDGFTYQVRNRVTLCRCGNSCNKPFCDGTHASSKYRDGINIV